MTIMPVSISQSSRTQYQHMPGTSRVIESGRISASSSPIRKAASACLAWLDARPKRSVVFLCFESMGAFSAEQLKETALGPEWSGHGFLWVVRSPPDSDRSKAFERRPEPNLGTLLPEGFLDRTAGQGLVVPSWAPQVEVLSHTTVGAFVSHCGWNSSLEAIT